MKVRRMKEGRIESESRECALVLGVLRAGLGQIKTLSGG